jgi:hypothetical protein
LALAEIRHDNSSIDPPAAPLSLRITNGFSRDPYSSRIDRIPIRWRPKAITTSSPTCSTRSRGASRFGNSPDRMRQRSAQSHSATDKFNYPVACPLLTPCVSSYGGQQQYPPQHQYPQQGYPPQQYQQGYGPPQGGMQYQQAPPQQVVVKQKSDKGCLGAW